MTRGRQFRAAKWVCGASAVVVLAVTFVAYNSRAHSRVGARTAVGHEAGAIPQSPAMSKDVAEKLARAESQTAVIPTAQGKPPVTFSLVDVMSNFKDPAVSIAIIDNFQIVAVKAYGTLGNENPAPTGTKTLFQAGSVSKPVTAAAALALVESGRLDLDANVNEKLKSWKVPDNQFTVKEKVTLRRLLSHTAGTNVHGFPGYDVDSPLPTVVQVLNGEKPANTEAVRVVMTPGTQQVYSGGGITIEQLLLTDVTGKAFPDLLREMVLEKVGMHDSTFQQPLPTDLAARTAVGTYADGRSVHGKFHVYPEMAAAGLWTTPTDLALYAIEIAKSRNGKSNKILSEKMTTEMLTPIIGEGGLGFFMDKQTPGLFMHGGADEGFQCMFAMNYETGKGSVIMTNSDSGLFVEGQLRRAIAREFGWNLKMPDDTMTEIFLLDLANGSKAALARYDEIKKAAAPGRSVEESTLNLDGYALMRVGRMTDAIALLARNVGEYPKSFNVYDSLGEAYMRNGEKELAIQNYQKSLALEPRNFNAKDMLKHLGVSDAK
jgi:CubicO group peptidase (beta-lactamase class C family)